MAIRSKIHNYGNIHESEWPPRFPENPGRFRGYWDPESKSFKEGSPPNNNNHFGDAPIAIMHNMKPQYHNGVCREIDNIKEWDAADKETGLLTFTNHEEVRQKAKRGIEGERKEMKKDRNKASKAALESWRSNPRHMKQKLNKQTEKQLETLKKSGIDLADSGIKLKD